MPEQALYLKWRPTAFDEMVGQEHVTRTLRNALKTGRMRHAYLFSGPRGTGKTTTARLLAKAVNCHEADFDQRPCNNCPACIAVNEGRYLDLIEIDAATHTGVDDVRELRDRIAFAPGEGRYKVYIIDEVHRFSGSAFDALLKTLEEPPPHAIFVLATTEIDRVPETIKSRCLQFEFRRLSLHEVVDRLALIAESEGLKIERGALEVIARQGTGSARDSISLLDQIVSDPDEVITTDLAQRILGTASSRAVKQLVSAMIAGDVAQGLHLINEAVDSGSDPRQFGQQIVEYLRAVLLTQTASADLLPASQEEKALYAEQAAAFSRAGLLRAIRNFNEAVSDHRGGWQPQLGLELALIDSLRAAPDEEGQQVGLAQQPAWAQSAAPAGGGLSAADVEAIVRRMLAQSGGQSAPAPSPSAGKKAAKPAPVSESLPKNAPPVISPAVIRDKWVDVQRLAFQRNRLLPAAMEHAHVRTVSGNVVVLGVLQQVFQDKLSTPEALKLLEAIFSEVHGIALKVKVMLVERAEFIGVADESPAADAEDDPLLREAIELGAEVRPEED